MVEPTTVVFRKKMMTKMTQLFGIASLFLCIIRASSSFSLLTPSSSARAISSSSMHAYHFGAGAVNKEKPVQASKPKRYTSYVPDGLTQEEYMKIKSDEMAKQQKMNYGAWGPRFKLINGDPDSNWFNLPSLWTSGFNSNPNVSTSADLGDASTALAKMILTLRRVLIPYVTLLLSIHLLETSLSAKNILRGKLMITKYKMIVKVLAPLLVMKPLDFLATKLFRPADKDRTTKLSIGIGLILSAISLVLRRRM